MKPRFGDIGGRESIQLPGDESNSPGEGTDAKVRYVGALPGMLVQGLRKVGVSNPLILLDELDKGKRSTIY